MVVGNGLITNNGGEEEGGQDLEVEGPPGTDTGGKIVDVFFTKGKKRLLAMKHQCPLLNHLPRW